MRPKLFADITIGFVTKLRIVVGAKSEKKSTKLQQNPGEFRTCEKDLANVTKDHVLSYEPAHACPGFPLEAML